MEFSQDEQWLPYLRVASLVQGEALFVIIGALMCIWVTYQMTLRRASASRHRIIRKLFRKLRPAVFSSLALFALYKALSNMVYDYPFLTRLLPYLGMIILVLQGILIVKSGRLLASVFLFRSHMREGVPLLIINLISLILALGYGLWLLAAVFQIDLEPLLAPSAVLSIVLGLALQDTLGNLIAGIAMQLEADKPYEIGDWIEVNFNGQKWIGQVSEITWRATVLVAITEEILTIPNRVCAQAQIANFAARQRPFMRSHLLRFPYESDWELIRSTLLEAAQSIPAVLAYPPPLTLIFETTDSWVGIKLCYFIENFGSQLIVQDQVVQAAFDGLCAQGIKTAAPRLEISRAKPGPQSDNLSSSLIHQPYD